MGTVTILDPTAMARTRVEAPAGRLDTLDGRVVAILNNRWRSMDLVAQRFEARLRRERGVADVLQVVIPVTGAAPEALLDDVAGKAELAIVGLAN